MSATDCGGVPAIAWIVEELTQLRRQARKREGLVDDNELDHVLTIILAQIRNETPKPHTPSVSVACDACGGTNTQISLPAWFKADNIDELVAADEEAEPLSYYCEDCGECVPVTITDLATGTTRREEGRSARWRWC